MTETEQLKAFGNRIKEVRELKSMTQLQLGDAIGKSEKQIQTIEAGKMNSTVRVMYLLANAFEMRMAELYNFEI